MSLDPQVASVLHTLKSMSAKPVHRMTPAEARFAAWVYRYLGGFPERVARVSARFVPAASAWLPIRVYEPLQSARPGPALLYFHGGGFVTGNIAICDAFSRALANRSGCTVVAVNYRKAPEHKFPVPLDDCYAAACWLFANAAHLGIDAARIGVVGDSAGGTLAAAVALRARDERGPRLAYQVLIYPAVSYGWDTPSALAYGEGLGLERATMRYFWQHYVRNEADGVHPYCSPLLAPRHDGLPPALIVAAEHDPLRDDAARYAARLHESGVAVKHIVYDGMIHGFLWMAGVVDRSKQALGEIGLELRAALGSRSAAARPAFFSPVRRGQ
jgi:acetyl esterase